MAAGTPDWEPAEGCADEACSEMRCCSPCAAKCLAKFTCSRQRAPLRACTPATPLTPKLCYFAARASPASQAATLKASAARSATKKRSAADGGSKEPRPDGDRSWR